MGFPVDLVFDGLQVRHVFDVDQPAAVSVTRSGANRVEEPEEGRCFALHRGLYSGFNSCHGCRATNV